MTSVRISGALHEFTTLPGVQEDVTEILLNIKGIVLTSEYDEPAVMYLRKSGKGERGWGHHPAAGVTIATRSSTSLPSPTMANSRSSSLSSVAVAMFLPR